MIVLKSRRGKLIFVMSTLALGLVIVIVWFYQFLEFLDASVFCGEICHMQMYPEYNAYQASAHADIRCFDCHVGHGGAALIKSKIEAMPLMLYVVTGNYPRPIHTPVKSGLPPASKTCEHCHEAGSFSDDHVKVYTTYLPDEQNTEQVDTLVLNIGGGEFDIARDIHWHQTAGIWYLPLDHELQEIAWVGYTDDNNQLIEFIDPDKADEVTPQLIEDEKRLMDCIDCHNRIGHDFRSPDELIDESLALGKIDSSLPFIKKLGLDALDPPNSSLAEAIAKVEAIKDFYETNYLHTYKEKEWEIYEAVEELKEIARLTTYPFMKVTWDTYIDNLGHYEVDESGQRVEKPGQEEEDAGCFRCHGKLVATGWVLETHGLQQPGYGCDTPCHYRLPVDAEAAGD